MSSIKLQHLYQSDLALNCHSVFEFLCNLGGPSVIHLKGKDSSQCRVLLTLLHGNEPSGFKAVYKLLQENFEPLFDTKIIIASVLAARTEPIFTHRMLPGQRDLNRCFNDEVKDLQGELAKAIWEQIYECKPQAVIDLHNTSGSGPAFAVSVNDADNYIALASHFTHRLIMTDLRLGAVMEQDFNCPIVTIEAGGSQDEEADIVAYEGIKSFLSTNDLFEQRQDVELLHNPRRLELMDGTDIAYQSCDIENVDICMFQDIEKLNFGTTERGQKLGWSKHNSLQAFKLDSPEGKVSDYFYVDDHILYTKEALTMFMVTTRSDIAKSDCLFYFVAP